ncbi:MAG: PEGA domain-containing protein [Proteobacteria bacterium]|nr:PEGA domain-containing protein [Pseudomonadota bacterium]
MNRDRNGRLTREGWLFGAVLRIAWMASAVFLAVLPGAWAQRADRPDSEPGDASPRRSISRPLAQTSDTHEIDSCKSTLASRSKGNEARAYEHYQRGLKLYEQGDYEAAIEEFVRAYCHKPSATVLRDIAQSFERLVQYEKAVAYLERYILENPDSQREERRVQSGRVQVLRNLPARVHIATDPAHAEVTLISTSGVRLVGFSNAAEPMRVPRGTYAMTIELAGYETIKETIHVQIGQPYSYYYQLEPKKGTLRVVAVPATARIFVDKREVALGTYVDQLPVGEYTIRAEVDGRLAQTRTIEIIAGGQKNATFDLKRKPRSGRSELLISAAVGGLGFGSGTFSTIFGDDTLLGTIGGIVGLGLGFGSAYIAVPSDIPVGHSSYIIGSSLIGMAEAGLVSAFISCGTGGGCNQSLIVGTTLAGGTAGLLVSSLTADQINIDAGDAAIINSGALWGSISGALFWVVFGSNDLLDKPLIFGGLNLGLLTGALLAKRYRVSRSHVALIDLSGLLGLVVGASFVDVADLSDSIGERVPNFALLGMSIGLLTGAYFTRHMDEPPKSLNLVSPSVGATTDASGKAALTLGLQGRF